MRNAEDTDLLAAAGGGDREAFGTLVERHHRSIVQFVYRFLGGPDRATAEDLAQDVFLAAWQAAPSFEPRAKVVTWLLRIARNVCLNHRRGSRLRKTVSLEAVDAARAACASSDSPDRQVVADEAASRVRAAVTGLPPNQRAAILLRHFHGLRYADIADVLGVSVSAVESMLFRARRTLRATLQETDGDATPQVSPPSGAQ